MTFKIELLRIEQSLKKKNQTRKPQKDDKGLFKRLLSGHCAIYDLPHKPEE